jgi:hypothetical protein
MYDKLNAEIKKLEDERATAIKKLNDEHMTRVEQIISECLGHNSSQLLERSRMQKPKGSEFEPLDVIVVISRIPTEERGKDLVPIVLPARYETNLGKIEETYLATNLKAVALQTCYEFDRPVRVQTIQYANWAVPNRAWKEIGGRFMEHAESHPVLKTAGLHIRPLFIENVSNLLYVAPAPEPAPTEQTPAEAEAPEEYAGDAAGDTEISWLTEEEISRRFGYDITVVKAMISNGIFGDEIKENKKGGVLIRSVSEATIAYLIATKKLNPPRMKR